MNLLFQNKYGDVVFNQAFHKQPQESLESLIYNAVFSITASVKGTLLEVFQQLNLETLKLIC